MGRYCKYLYINLFILFVSVLLSGCQNRESIKDSNEQKDTPKGNFILNFKMTKNIDNQSGYYSISAIKGEYLDNGTVVLDNCSFIYKDKRHDVNVSAEKCSYEVDKNVILKRNMSCVFDGIKINKIDNGSFFYDVKTSKGSLDGGGSYLTAYKDNNSIRSKKAIFTKDNLYMEFIENVEVIYEK